LWPKAPDPNSLDIVLVAGSKRSDLSFSEDLGERIERVCRNIEGLLAVNARAEMPNAAAGANLYDVTSRWDAGPGLTLAETGKQVDDVPPARAAEPPLELPPGETKRRSVFISYSHRDQRWLARLQVHLRPLERRFDVQVWDDTKIEAGDLWREQIAQALASTRVAILLISADFIASDFIAKHELPTLLLAAERDGALILPVIVAPSIYSEIDELSRFQAANSPDKPLLQLSRGKQEQILTDVANQVLSKFQTPSRV
jgi:hypothetical protein